MGSACPSQAGRAGVKGFVLTLQQHIIIMLEQAGIAKFLFSISYTHLKTYLLERNSDFSS